MTRWPATPTRFSMPGQCEPVAPSMVSELVVASGGKGWPRSYTTGTYPDGQVTPLSLICFRMSGHVQLRPPATVAALQRPLARAEDATRTRAPTMIVRHMAPADLINPRHQSRELFAVV